MARLRSTSGGSSDDYHSGSEGPLGEMSSAPRDDIDGLLNTPGAFSTTDSHPDSRGPPSSMMSVDVHDDEEHGELEDLSSFKPSPLSDRFEEEFFESNSMRTRAPESNVGANFFRVLDSTTGQLSTLGWADVEAGLMALHRRWVQSAGANCVVARFAAQRLNMQEGWGGFSRSANVRELALSLVALAQAGIGLLFIALLALVYVLHGMHMVFVRARAALGQAAS